MSFEPLMADISRRPANRFTSVDRRQPGKTGRRPRWSSTSPEVLLDCWCQQNGEVGGQTNEWLGCMDQGLLDVLE